MRRLAATFALIATAAAVFLAASATGDDTHTYYIELDNAFGLVNGSEVKVAGVSAGNVTKLDINSDKRAVLKVELSGPVAVLGEDTICSTAAAVADRRVLHRLHAEGPADRGAGHLRGGAPREPRHPGRADPADRPARTSS